MQLTCTAWAVDYWPQKKVTVGFSHRQTTVKVK
jgi:hypothetical protein